MVLPLREALPSLLSPVTESASALPAWMQLVGKIESLRLDLSEKGDTGIVVPSWSFALIGGAVCWTSRECGVEGDNDEDHGLSPPWEMNTDAFRIWSKSAVAALSDCICWERSGT